MNSIFLLGRLTKDPEVRYTPTGRVDASFVLAVDRPFLTPKAKEKPISLIALFGDNQLKFSARQLSKDNVLW